LFLVTDIAIRSTLHYRPKTGAPEGAGMTVPSGHFRPILHDGERSPVGLKASNIQNLSIPMMAGLARVRALFALNLRFLRFGTFQVLKAIAKRGHTVKSP
jgi:hypothetical protein